MAIKDTKEWIKKHDAELFGWSLYVILKTSAAFTTPEQAFWYATLHGHSDDVLGAMLMITFIKYFWENVSDEK